jgi:hypothetical protein
MHIHTGECPALKWLVHGGESVTPVASKGVFT